MDTKYVVIIQCDIAQKRCSGFACTNAFYNREEKFQGYNNDTRYISFTCGGCCGKSIAAKLEHFFKKAYKKCGLNKDETVIHLASCVVTDNHHYNRCPHIDYLKEIIIKKGYTNIVDGSYISKNAKNRRANNIYKNY